MTFITQHTSDFSGSFKRNNNLHGFRWWCCSSRTVYKRERRISRKQSINSALKMNTVSSKVSWPACARGVCRSAAGRRVSVACAPTAAGRHVPFCAVWIREPSITTVFAVLNLLSLCPCSRQWRTHSTKKSALHVTIRKVVSKSLFFKAYYERARSAKRVSTDIH